MSIRILLADDHKILREGLAALLEKQPGMKVVGEAANGRSAVRSARELRPDIVIIDIAMPDLNGIEATRQIIAEVPGAKVIALSMHSDRRFVKGMLQAGASGYLLKQNAYHDLVRAIQTAMANLVYLSPEITGVLVKNYKSALSDSSALALLTAREREVLQLFAEGQSSREIADIIHVSLKTVEAYRRQIMNKLGFKRLAELIKFAIREGLTFLDH